MLVKGIAKACIGLNWLTIGIGVDLFWTQGCAVAQLVEVLRYKQEGRGFSSRLCHWIFHCLNHFGRPMALGSTPGL
jgi:hypothetical protein